jgi:hypothetical protein
MLPLPGEISSGPAQGVEKFLNIKIVTMPLKYHDYRNCGYAANFIYRY